MPLAFLLALFLLSTHPTCSRQLEQTVDCPAGVEHVTIKNYFFLDLYGYPAFFDVEQGILEDSFEEVYKNMSTCEVNMEASILTDMVAGYDDFDDVNAVEKQFSHVMTATMDWCRPTSCSQLSSIFHQLSTRRELRQARNCDCEGPDQEGFLRQWQEEDTSGYRIIGLTDVVWENGCDSTVIQHYDTSVVVMLETQMQFWTDHMLNQVGGLVVETYNQLNTLYPELCDPHRRQLVVAETQLFDFLDTLAILEVTLSGYCLDCIDTPLFDIALDGRRASEDIVNITCLCSETADVMRGPTVDEFIQEFGQAVAQLAYVQSLFGVEEQATACDVPQPDEEFQVTFHVEFRVLCEFLEDDVPQLPIHFVETYNALVEEDFCDPYLQTLDVAAVVSTGNRTDVDGVLVSFYLQGTCQACSNASDQLFSYETSERRLHLSAFNAPQTRRRSLHRCDCSDNALHDRPPTELEFLAAFNQVIEQVSDEFICIVSVSGFESNETLAPTPAPSVQICNTTLETMIVSTISVDVETGETMLGEGVTELGQLIVQTYNALINILYSECDAEYRLMTSAIIFSNVTTKVLYEISGLCSGCVDGDYFDPDVLSEDTFLSYLYNTTDMSSFDFTVSSIQEVTEMECSMDSTTFQDFVIVEFDSDCSGGLTLNNTNLVGELEDAYVSTYNELSLQYCDPFDRILNSAKIVRIGEETDTGGTPVEMKLRGSCTDCDLIDIEVYDVPSSADSRRRLGLSQRGRLLDITESCYCPSHPIGERAPYEAELIHAYQAVVSELILEQCSVSVKDCEYGTVFETGLLVDIDSISTELTTGEIVEMEESFKDSINELYENTDESCNPDYRVVESVQALLLTDEGRRALWQPHADRVVDGDNGTNSSSFPTMTPSESFGLEYLFYVSGLCNGCSSEITLSDQLSGRRFLSGEEGVESIRAREKATSNCYCQLGAVIDRVPPKAEKLREKLNGNLNDKNLTLGVGDMDEKPVVSCKKGKVSFEKEQKLSMFLTYDVEIEEVEALGKLFKKTYNDLIALYCDPQERRLTRVDVDRYKLIDDTQSAICGEFRITFAVSGTCFDCTDNVPIFDAGSSRRLSGEARRTFDSGNEIVPNFRRRLVDARDCFCAGDTVANRAPTREEFEAALDIRLESAKVKNICGLDVEDVPPTKAPRPTKAPKTPRPSKAPRPSRAPRTPCPNRELWEESL